MPIEKNINLNNVAPKDVADAHYSDTNNPHGVTVGQIGAQPTLVSGVNIKTINSISLLGSGNIAISSTNFANGNLTLDNDRTHDFANKQMTWNNIKQFKLVASVAPPIGRASFEIRGFGSTASDRHFALRNPVDTGDFLAVVGDGKVGIGTSAPSARLSVHKSSGAPVPLPYTWAADSSAVMVSEFIDSVSSPRRPHFIISGTNIPSNDSTALISAGNANSGFSFVTREQNSPFALFARMVITGGGNVGIGQTTPTARLHVKSSSTSTDIFKLENLAGTANILNITEGQTRYDHSSIAPPIGEASFRLRGFGSTSSDRHFALRNSADTGDLFRVLGDGESLFNNPSLSTEGFKISTLASNQHRVGNNVANLTFGPANAVTANNVLSAPLLIGTTTSSSPIFVGTGGSTGTALQPSNNFKAGTGFTHAFRITGDYSNAADAGTRTGNALGVFTSLNGTLGNVTFNNFVSENVINLTTGTTKFRGFYHNPTLTNTVGLENIAFEATSGKIKLPLTTYADNATAATALGGTGFLYKLADGTVKITV